MKHSCISGWALPLTILALLPAVPAVAGSLVIGSNPGNTNVTGVSFINLIGSGVTAPAQIESMEVHYQLRDVAQGSLWIEFGYYNGPLNGIILRAPDGTPGASDIDETRIVTDFNGVGLDTLWYLSARSGETRGYIDYWEIRINYTLPPNLTAAIAPDLSSAIVVSRQLGRPWDSTGLRPTDSLYVSWSVKNNGDLPVTNAFSTDLFVDGILRNSWRTQPVIVPRQFVKAYDFPIGSLSLGSHNITLKTDSTNEVAEWRESDNQFTRTIDIVSTSTPNLTSYQPAGWSDRIVLSRTTGATTDSPTLTTSDSPYVHWAIINNGGANVTTPFNVWLTVNDIVRGTWSIAPPLNGETSVTRLDFPIGPLPPGRSFIGISIDANRTVSENDEGDNLYYKTVTVIPADANALQIAPFSTNVVPGSSFSFTILNGTPPYTFSIFPNNSGASIDVSGLYTAGFSWGTDIIRVTDAANNTTAASVLVDTSPAARKQINVGARRSNVGSVTYNGPGSYTIVGGGLDTWDNIDDFTFSYEEMTGDFDVRVRVQSLSENSRWTKAGIMIRESLAEDSRTAFVRITPRALPVCAGDGNGANETRLFYRTGFHEPTGTAGDDHNGGLHDELDASNPLAAPHYPNAWLRLVRVGSVLTAYNSANGSDWYRVASQDTTTWNGGAFKTTALLGLAVATWPGTGSGCPSATAEFRDYLVCPGGTGPFKVAGADSRGNPNGVRVEFSKPVMLSGATFTLNNGATVNSVAPGPNASTVQLNTSALSEGTLYTVTVSGAISFSHEALTVNSAQFRHGAGYEQRRIHVSHNMIGGGDALFFGHSTAYQLGLPVASQGRPAIEANTLFEDTVPNTLSNEYFATRIVGVLNINAAANYRFACSTDDRGFLFLSTDETPAHKVVLAREPEWQDARAYAACDRRTCIGGVPQENQAVVHLEPGRCYLELIANEGGGFNNASATWDGGTGSSILNGQTPLSENLFVPSRFAFGEIFYTLGPAIISRQPYVLNHSASRITLSVGVDGTPPYKFQWFKGSNPIPGASSIDYSIPNPQPSDVADYTVTVANEFGTALSAPVSVQLIDPVFHVADLSADRLTFSWASAASEVLQFAESLIPPIAWRDITTGITDNGTTKSYSETGYTNKISKFFRLNQDRRYNAGTGHYYEFVAAPGITWSNAMTGAAARTLYGLRGYLATITSAQENAFAYSQIAGHAWIGASDATVEGEWRWVTGPEAGQQFWQGLNPGGGGYPVSGAYANWNGFEPNNNVDAGGPGGEDFAQILFDSLTGPAAGWNDAGNAGFSGLYIQGYLVEYGGLP